MNDKKTSEQVMREGLESIVFFSQGCYDSEYFANIAKKALEESKRLKDSEGGYEVKLVKCNGCKEDFAIDLDRPDMWHCPYCDKSYAEIGGEDE